MKYICLGYLEEQRWEAMSPSERDTCMKECYAFVEELQKGGHFLGGEALQGVRTAATLRWQGGKVSVTDGPFAETKEQLGGLVVFEANDLNHAIALFSRHPGLRVGGCMEIRPAEDCGFSSRTTETGGSIR
jgi:hypothetical protein